MRKGLSNKDLKKVNEHNREVMLRSIGTEDLTARGNKEKVDSNSPLIYKNINKQAHSQKLMTLDAGKVLYNINIEKLSKTRHDTGEIDHKMYHIYINNVRKGEIVDIEIKKVIPERGIAFADVCNYKRTVGDDYYRRYNCPKEKNSNSSGGMNRTKCVSVFYPEERERKPTHIKKRHYQFSTKN